MLCLTFDIEERFHSHLTPDDTPREWSLHDRIARIIDWVEERQQKATFFVVAELAEQYPDLIRSMIRAGCEIASHSYQHILLDERRKEACKEDIRISKLILEEISGRPVYGFRAPTWSAKRSDKWLWEHLCSLGFQYDSSLFPIKTHNYGSFDNPAQPYRIHPELGEIPPSVHVIGPIRIPYGGGFYFRLYPLLLTKYFMKHAQQTGNVPLLYFHPWDFEFASQTFESDCLNRFIGNYNIKHTWRKFTALLDGSTTISIYDYIQQFE